MLTANFHTHSTYCDGANTPREMVDRALELGFTALGFSSHFDPEIEADHDRYVREIRSLAAELSDRIEILCGGEVDLLYRNMAQLRLDYAIGSSHFLEVGNGQAVAIDSTEEILLKLYREHFAGRPYDMSRRYFEGVGRIYGETHCAFIGHFDLIAKYNHQLRLFDEDDPRYWRPALEAMEKLVSEGMRYFEINTRRVESGRIYPAARFLRHLKSLGGEILINSDAHAASQLSLGFDAALELAKSCGFDHTNLLSMRSGALEYVPVAI